MAYTFTNQTIGTTKATIAGADTAEGETFTHNLSGINTRENSADSIMGGINELYGIVGWQAADLTRTVKQDVEETT